MYLDHLRIFTAEEKSEAQREEQPERISGSEQDEESGRKRRNADVSSDVSQSTRGRPFGSRRKKRNFSSSGIGLDDTNEVSGEALMRSSCSHALPADACGARERDPSHDFLLGVAVAPLFPLMISLALSDYLSVLSRQTSQTEGAAGQRQLSRTSPAPANGEAEVTS